MNDTEYREYSALYNETDAKHGNADNPKNK